MIESRLVKIWENVLGVRPIGVRHNFFELGGNSLVAVRLMQRIEQAFGKKLADRHTLPGSDHRAIGRDSCARRDGRHRPRVWCRFKPAAPSRLSSVSMEPNGTVVRFYDLARHLGSDQPFYGLQAQGLDAEHPCHTRAEDMAARTSRKYAAFSRKGLISWEATLLAAWLLLRWPSN